MVDLLVIAFSSNEGHFPLKSLCADLVLVEKARMVASCQFFTAFLVRQSVCRLWRFVRRCSYKLHVQFSDVVFQLALRCVFRLLPVKSEVCVHSEVLSSLWQATPTQYIHYLKHRCLIKKKRYTQSTDNVRMIILFLSCCHDIKGTHVNIIYSCSCVHMYMCIIYFL